MGLRPEANVASERRVATPTTAVTLANDCGGGTVGGEPRSGDRLKPNPFILFAAGGRRYSIRLNEPYIGYPTMYASVVIGGFLNKLRKKAGCFHL